MNQSSRCNMMNIRHLEKRLRKLESTLQCEPNKTFDYICALLSFAVAYYLGDPSRHQKPFAAFASCTSRVAKLGRELDFRGRLRPPPLPSLHSRMPKPDYLRVNTRDLREKVDVCGKIVGLGAQPTQADLARDSTISI